MEGRHPTRTQLTKLVEWAWARTSVLDLFEAAAAISPTLLALVALKALEADKETLMETSRIPMRMVMTEKWTTWMALMSLVSRLLWTGSSARHTTVRYRWTNQWMELQPTSASKQYTSPAAPTETYS